MPDLPQPITELLDRWQQEDPSALDRLMPIVFDELRGLARHYFEREAPERTLQPTALVNEVYLRLRQDSISKLENRSQFFACAARLMRQILIDAARARQTLKRGGQADTIVLDEAAILPRQGALDAASLLALDQALDRLDAFDPRSRQIVELRYFTGLSQREVAEVLEISLATVERGWHLARHWLAREMSK